jgi:uncharacterized membrane protein YbhN (UPF0104 family)
LSQSPKRKKLIQALRWFTGIAILGYLVHFIDPKLLWKMLTSADWRYIPLWIVIYLVAQCLGTFKIYLLFQPVMPVGYWTLLRYDVVATSIGYFTPGQIGGPVSLAMFLRRQSVQFVQSTSVLVLDKIITLAVASSLGAIGVWQALHDRGASLVGTNTLLLGCGAMLPPVIIAFLGRQNVGWRQRADSVWIRVKEFGKSLKSQLKAKYLFFNIACTFAVQAVTAASWILSLKAIGKSVSYGSMITTGPAIAIIGYIPVSISGLGTQELGALALWRHVGISAVEAVAAFAFARVLLYGMGLSLLLLNVLFKRSFEKMRRNEDV